MLECMFRKHEFRKTVRESGFRWGVGLRYRCDNLQIGKLVDKYGFNVLNQTHLNSNSRSKHPLQFSVCRDSLPFQHNGHSASASLIHLLHAISECSYIFLGCPKHSVTLCLSYS